MTLQRLSLFALLLILLAIPIYFLRSATTATATVNYSVTATDAISVSGNPGTLTINAGSPGNPPTPATDSTTSYAVTTNNTNRQITGQITSGTLASGLTLSVALQAPTGATSQGTVELSPSSTNPLVTGISNLNESNLTIIYTLAGDASASPGTGSVTVTYTLTP